MADLVTLDEARQYLQLTHGFSDPSLALLVAAASEAVLDIASDWDGEGEPPARLKLAVLQRVTIAFQNRDSVEGPAGELALLQPLRSLEV
ncbi:head-tail connector protein [Xanthobacter sp. V7C-4]|uniref:head-tail connector protein n=1 Tax=Xanthobacter autotrophicus (strain ATCC BAA-1158 / Py2) TaxID=78245 RepID=UPI003728592B